MKVILAQPSIKRFQWELEVLLTNLRQFGDYEVVLLFSKHDDTVPTYLANKYGCSVFVYDDNRFDKRYIPAIRPYLFWQYLKEDPSREQEEYLYIDSDIIFREMIDFAKLGANESTWVGADCNSYINLDYILSCDKGEKIAAKMAEICGITVEDMKGVPGIGAQLYLVNPTADFWERAYDDSNTMYEYFMPITTNLQKWTAEMWAQLWGMVRDGKTLKISDELDFCRPTDPIERWDQYKIMHNAGVTGSGEMFFKGQYVDRVPFGEDFPQINPKKVSAKYVEAIQNVVF